MPFITQTTIHVNSFFIDSISFFVLPYHVVLLLSISFYRLVTKLLFPFSFASIHSPFAYRLQCKRPLFEAVCAAAGHRGVIRFPFGTYDSFCSMLISLCKPHRRDEQRKNLGAQLAVLRKRQRVCAASRLHGKARTAEFSRENEV